MCVQRERRGGGNWGMEGTAGYRNWFGIQEGLQNVKEVAVMFIAPAAAAAAAASVVDAGVALHQSKSVSSESDTRPPEPSGCCVTLLLFRIMTCDSCEGTGGIGGTGSSSRRNSCDLSCFRSDRR